MSVDGYDHVAMTVADLEATCAFYDKLFGAETHVDFAPHGKSLVRQIKIGGAMVSVLQAGNGIALQARALIPGAVDICFRWSQPIETAAALLEKHNISIVDGPSSRKFSDGRDSVSVYFRDPDGNLIELMAAA